MTTKTARTLLVSQTLAAGASINATELNLTSARSAEIYVKITNGSSAPTTAPTVTYYSGEATGIKRKRYSATGDTVGSSVTDIPCAYYARHMFANVTIQNGATNAITVETGPVALDAANPAALGASLLVSYGTSNENLVTGKRPDLQAGAGAPDPRKSAVAHPLPPPVTRHRPRPS
eukprot:gene4229-5005_t